MDNDRKKPRTCKIIKDYMEECGLVDAGEQEKISTWRRAHRAHIRSRIDYILHTDNMQGENVRVRWSLLDHALLDVTIRYEKSNYIRRIYTDWVLTQPDFIDQGSCIIC